MLVDQISGARSAEGERATGWRAALLIGMIGLAVIGCYYQGVRLGMKHGPVSERYTQFAIPVVLSQQTFGHRGAYTGYRDVATVFDSRDGQGVNDRIAVATSLPKIDRSELWFIPCDDKGLVDFVRLAFFLFGRRVESFYYAFFLLLTLTIVLYLLHDWRSTTRLLLLLLFVASLYVTVFIIPLTDQFRNIHEPRFFGILAVVPTLHLMSDCLAAKWPSKKHFLCTILQIALLCVVYHARSSTAWQVILILFVAFARIAWLLLASSAPGVCLGGSRLLRGLRPMWPAGLLLLGLGSLGVYQRVTYHPRYFQATGAQHVFWHNALQGFALHPKLAERCGWWGVYDVRAYNNVERFLLETGDTQRWQAIYGSPDDWKDNGATLNWLLYEQAGRDLFFHTCRKYPCAAATTFLWYKPRFILRQFLWAAGLFHTDLTLLYPSDHRILPQQTRLDYHVYYNPFRWEVLLIVFVAFGLARTMAKINALWLIAGLLFLGSLLPAFATYPLHHLMGEPYVLGALFLYTSLFAMVSLLMTQLLKLLRYSRGSLPSGSAPLAPVDGV